MWYTASSCYGATAKTINGKNRRGTTSRSPRTSMNRSVLPDFERFHWRSRIGWLEPVERARHWSDETGAFDSGRSRWTAEPGPRRLQTESESALMRIINQGLLVHGRGVKRVKRTLFDVNCRVICRKVNESRRRSRNRTWNCWTLLLE